MPTYAWYDPEALPNAPVKGWFDTDLFTYASLPPSTELLELQPFEWTARLNSTWAVSNGALVVYTPPTQTPVLSPAQQAAVALSAGLTITSANNPDLNGTYDCGPATQNHIQAEILSVLINGTFADGETTLIWPDSSATNHTFPSTTSFRAFATAVGSYVAALAKIANGTLTTMPPSTIAI